MTLPKENVEVLSLDEKMTFDVATGNLTIDFTGSLGSWQTDCFETII